MDMRTLTEDRARKLLDACELAGEGRLFDEVDMVRGDTRTNLEALVALLARIEERCLPPESIAAFDRICNGAFEERSRETAKIDQSRAAFCRTCL